jgi:uncharacterized hydrophobic protein (TIGR00271 family)
VFELRAYGEPAAIAKVSAGLSGLSGVRHLSVAAAEPGHPSTLTADIRPDAADAALAILERSEISPDDIVLTRLETIDAARDDAGPNALVWADVLGQARVAAQARARYLTLMSAAGVVAAFAVLNKSPVLIVGAMAISPDLMPITAACTGLVLHRPRLALRGLGALLVGLTVAGAVSGGVTGLLSLFDLLPPGFSLGEIPAAQSHVGVSTIFIAFAAGVAGMLAVETRASSAVGVAISVTTIPAAAYLGVGLGIGDGSAAVSALWVLLANVLLMLAGGSSTLAIQRTTAARE